MLRKYITLCAAILLAGYFVSCENAKENKTGNETEALELMKLHCFSCHGAIPQNKIRLAPPFRAVKKHYLDIYADRDAFIEEFTASTLNPSADNSKMPQAVKRFGLMPKPVISKEDVGIIAAYIYDNELGGRKWMNAQTEGIIVPEKDILPIDRGKQHAMALQALLGRNLRLALEKGGAEYALEFCNVKATHLSDSVSESLHADVRRVSDRYRNVHNKADEQELVYLENFRKAIINNSPPEPFIVEAEDSLIGYYPILTSGMCLQCHGEPGKDIKQSTLEKINALYPGDLATGYAENELRGMFVVRMPKDK